jgi:ankyrin repeat protein
MDEDDTNDETRHLARSSNLNTISGSLYVTGLRNFEKSKSYYDNLAENVLNNKIEELSKEINKEILTHTNFRCNSESVSSEKQLSFDGLTLMHIAAMSDSLECFIYLMKNTHFDFTVLSADEFTPMHYACCFKSIEIISYIIELSKYKTEYADKLQRLYLEDAERKGEKSLMKLATSALSIDIIKLLFDSGYKLTPEVRVHCINIAVNTKSVDVLNILLQNSSGKDSSPLITAISNNNLEAIPILIESNCNLQYCTSNFTTALSAACKQSSVSVVKMLCDKMTDVDINPVLKVDAACHWICISGSPEIARIILAHDIDVNRLNADNKTCVSLMKTVIPEEDDIEILEMLLEKGFNINHTPISPLTNYVTGIKKKPKVVAWFIENGFNLNAKVNNKYTFREYIIKYKDRFPGIAEKYLT